MIPVRDLLPTRRRPVLTWALIALNAVVFVYELVLEPDALEQLVHLWGLVPLRFVEALDGSDPQALLTPLSSMFLHGSWLHVIGNLWFLQVFGDNVEDDLGRGRYLLLYVATGLAAVAEQPCRLGLVASTCHTSQSTLAAGAKQRVPVRDAEGRVLLEYVLYACNLAPYAYPHRM